MNVFLFLLVFLFTVFEVQVNAGPFCDSADIIDEKVSNCQENLEFQKASEKCLLEFKKQVELTKNHLNGILIKPIENTAHAGLANRQKKNLNSAGKNFDNTGRDLAVLIADAKSTLVVMRQYFGYLVFPYTWPEEMPPDLNDPEVISDFSEYSCYGEPHTNIKKNVEQFAKMIGELEAGKGAAEILKTGALAGEKSLDRSEDNQVILKDKKNIERAVKANGSDPVGINAGSSGISDSRAKLDKKIAPDGYIPTPGLNPGKPGQLGPAQSLPSELPKDEDKQWMNQLLEQPSK